MGYNNPATDFYLTYQKAYYMILTLSLPSRFAAPPELILEMKTPSSVRSSGLPRCPLSPPLICIPSFSPSAFTILISYCKQTERYTELELTAHSGGPHFYVTSESKENNLCSKNFNEFGVQLIAKSILVSLVSNLLSCTEIQQMLHDSTTKQSCNDI